MRGAGARGALVWALCLAAAAAGRGYGTEVPGKQAPPKVMLWSWFAEDDFRPLAKQEIGVAYLALSLEFAGQNQVTPEPRSIPVRIPPGMYQMAVVRFDSARDAGQTPAFSPRQRELAVKMVAEIASIVHPQAIQIDFDAPRRAWPFYRQLLAEIRARLRPEIFLSMTALVSWCDTDTSWLAGLPVDETLPMAFSMGQAAPATIAALRQGGQFRFSGCRGSIGVQLPAGDQLFAQPRKGQRAYFFPGGQKWSEALVAGAQRLFLP